MTDYNEEIYILCKIVLINWEVKNIFLNLILSLILVSIDRVWIGNLDLLTPYTNNLYLQAIQHCR
jgi:hypothetical protein